MLFSLNRLLLLLGVVAIFNAGNRALAQSGWPRARGELYAKLTLGGFTSSDYYNLDGNLVETAAFRSGFGNIYAEYGLTDKLTVLADWPVYKLQGYETTETVSGIGDLKLGLKYALWGGAFPATITVMPEIPTGPSDLRAQNLMNAFEVINLPTGDGEFNLHGTLAVSHSFYPLPIYVNGFLGYNLRTQYQGQSFQDQLRGGVEIGGKLGEVVWVRLNMVVQESLGDTPQFTDFVRGEGTGFSGLLGGITWMLNPAWGIDFAYQTYLSGPVARTNVYDNHLFMLGISYQLTGD